MFLDWQSSNLLANGMFTFACEYLNEENNSVAASTPFPSLLPSPPLLPSFFPRIFFASSLPPHPFPLCLLCRLRAATNNEPEQEITQVQSDFHRCYDRTHQSWRQYKWEINPDSLLQICTGGTNWISGHQKSNDSWSGAWVTRALRWCESWWQASLCIY